MQDFMTVLRELESEGLFEWSAARSGLRKTRSSLAAKFIHRFRSAMQYVYSSNQSMKPTAPLRNKCRVFATSPYRGLSLSGCLGAFISGRATAARGTLPTVLPATALGKLLHKEIQIRPQRPSIPKNPSAKTRNDAGCRESASPKTVPVA